MYRIYEGSCQALSVYSHDNLKQHLGRGKNFLLRNTSTAEKCTGCKAVLVLYGLVLSNSKRDQMFQSCSEALLYQTEAAEHTMYLQLFWISEAMTLSQYCTRYSHFMIHYHYLLFNLLWCLQAALKEWDALVVERIQRRKRNVSKRSGFRQ